MSIIELERFIRYLKRNQQSSERYEMAFWKRLAAPWSAIAMLLMALPFAYLQPRSGALSGRILAGVMIGVVFHLAVTLLGNIALIQQWPASLITMIPALILILISLASLQWVNRSQAIWPLNATASVKPSR